MNALQLAAQIQQIPSPTFAEHRLAEFVRDKLKEAGAHDATMIEHDEFTVNTYARLPGSNPELPAVVVSAHTDTVFPADTDLGSRQEGNKLYGPGIGDNSIAVAAMITVAARLSGERLPRDIWFVANAAEEGLGDLRGIRAAMDHIGPPNIHAAVVIEGMALDSIYRSGVAVRRYRLTVETAGGHSWGDYGSPSAIHVLMNIGAKLSDVDLPATPRTTLNIGLVGGGTSVNTIAAEAFAEIDFRSESDLELSKLEDRLRSLVAAAERPEITITTRRIGERPAGEIPRSHPLVMTAVRELNRIGITPRFPNGSTDANALLAAGVPAICVGVTRGDNAHRSDEWIETEPIESGLGYLEALVRSVCDGADAG